MKCSGENGYPPHRTWRDLIICPSGVLQRVCGTCQGKCSFLHNASFPALIDLSPFTNSNLLSNNGAHCSSRWRVLSFFLFFQNLFSEGSADCSARQRRWVEKRLERKDDISNQKELTDYFSLLSSLFQWCVKSKSIHLFSGERCEFGEGLTPWRGWNKIYF